MYIVRSSRQLSKYLPLECKTKIAADDILIFHYYLSKKIRLDVLSEAEDSLETSSLIFSEKQ